VYGRNPVRELLRAGRRRARSIVALPDLAAERWLRDAGARAASRAEIGRLAGSSDHQGVVAVCDPYPYADPALIVAAAGPVVCLDGVQDPRNLGAVARVAEAAGAAGLVIPERGSPGVTPVVCKASAGAVEHLRLARVVNLAAFIHDARGTTRFAVGADASEGRDYRDLSLDMNSILVLGGEGTGLRPRVRRACDELIQVPMRGHTESLNLSTAAAVLIFEAVREAPWRDPR
jgi:23S rRNA (guanosine2251-2'-O)-methyltransferase